MTIIYFLLLLSAIILIHEAGHLVAAKLFGVYCYEFSFGMGPVLLKHKGKETQYSLRALPVGGFVAMAGETDGDEAYPDVEVPVGRRLTEKKPWQKIIIMLAGVFMNFVLAFMIFSLVILHNGTFASSPKAVVSTVVENSPAEKAGFQSGDKILEITKKDGSSIKPETFMDMQAFSSGYADEETYKIDRDGEILSITLTPEYSEEQDAYLIGITGERSEYVDVNILNCWKFGLEEMGAITKLMIVTIAGLIFHGAGMSQLSGPVGIYQATETYASMGLSAFLLLIAQLSLNVGIFNLLPLPVLDGGQVVITLLEWITNRKFSTKIKTAIMIACWVLLIGLMVFVTWNDIARLIGG